MIYLKIRKIKFYAYLTKIHVAENSDYTAPKAKLLSKPSDCSEARLTASFSSFMTRSSRSSNAH